MLTQLCRGIFIFLSFYSRVVWSNKKHFLCFFTLLLFSVGNGKYIFSFSVSSHSYPDLSQAYTHTQTIIICIFLILLQLVKCVLPLTFFISPPVIFKCAIVNVSHAYLRWRTFFLLFIIHFNSSTGNAFIIWLFYFLFFSFHFKVHFPTEFSIIINFQSIIINKYELFTHLCLIKILLKSIRKFNIFSSCTLDSICFWEFFN